MKRIYGCIFDDEIGLANRDVIGMDQICFETDYPHADSTFPHSKKVATEICTEAGLDDEETYKFIRGNAIRALRPGALRHHEVARPLARLAVAWPAAPNAAGSKVRCRVCSASSASASASDTSSPRR